MKPLHITLLVSALLAALPAHAADDGKAVFERVCAACHLPTGEGLPGAFPPVKQSDYVKKATPAQLVKLLANGLTGPVKVNGQSYNSAMPPQDLSDADMASVINYLNNNLNGNKAQLTADQVKKLRSAK
ncbi:MAG: cytochrome c [Rhodocyclaceae bacterium]